MIHPCLSCCKIIFLNIHAMTYLRVSRFTAPIWLHVFDRPLTEAEIAEKRRKAKEKLAERAAARSQGETTEMTALKEEISEGCGKLFKVTS